MNIFSILPKFGITARILSTLVCLIGFYAGKNQVWGDDLPVKTTNKLRVMTLNLRFDFFEDKQKKRSWSRRLPLIVKVIKDAKIDILGTQEDKYKEVAELGKKLKIYKVFGGGRFANGRGERTAIWYQKKHFTLKTQGEFWLSKTPLIRGSKSWKEKFPHKVTWGILQNKSQGKCLVLNTHFDSKVALAKKKAAKIICEWLVKQDSNLPIILVGDFNLGQKETAYKTLVTDRYGYRLADAWNLVKPKVKWQGTYHGFEGWKTHKRLDLILLSATLKCNSIKIIKYNKKGLYPSDHYPLLAVLQLFE